MSKNATTTKINRRFVPSLLAKQYIKDYQASIAEFPPDKKIELVEHLLECLDIVEAYMANPTKENWKNYATKENVFLKKHGKRLKVYRQKNMYLYYGDPTLLAEKEIYSTEEWNALKIGEQQLSSEEFASFAKLCRNALYFERDFLLVEQIPKDEKEEDNTDGLGGKKSTKMKQVKINREAQDKKTSLSQEQTVLLIHLLREEKVLLKEQDLNDKDAGIAFEILTGYSQNTLRINLGQPHLRQNKINLKEIDNLLTRLKINIGKDLKEK